MSPVEVTSTTDLAEPLSLLEESLRGGEPVPEAFAEKLRKSLEAGDIEVLTLRTEGRLLGVAVLAYRLNVAAGGLFASIEELYVRPKARHQGAGRALLAAADQRFKARGISYVEVQVEDDEAEAFYRTLGYESERGTSVLSRSLPIEDREEAESSPL